MTKAVISAAVSTDKLTANEVDAASIVTRSLLTSLLKANKITANEIGSGAVTTNNLGAKAVTAEKVDVEELVASEAFVGQFAANTAIIEQIYAAAVVAKEITARKLKVAGDDSYAEVENGVLTLFDSSSSSLTELAASYANFCQGKLKIKVDGINAYLMNTEPTGALVISGNLAYAAGSWGSPCGTATMAEDGSMALSSVEQVIPFTQIHGRQFLIKNNGVQTSGHNNPIVAGFAMFEGVADGTRCCLDLYEGSTHLAQAITTSAGDHCTVSIGPIARDSYTSNTTYYLKARIGAGQSGGYIGAGADADTKAALTVWT